MKDVNEMQRAIELLREFQDQWQGMVSQVPCDPCCRFDAQDGDGPCNKPATVITMFAPSLPLKPKDEAVAIVNCEHHARVMKKAVEYWRTYS